MSAINVNSITGRTGSHGPVLTGVTTVSGDLIVGSGLSVTGISTFSNTVVGGATTELVVTGDARITGILTIGTASVTLNGTDGTITGINTINGLTYPSSGPLSNRNLVINGAMNVAQRSSSFVAVSNSSNEGYQTLDRFGVVFASGAGGACSIGQSVTVPSNQGFSNSYKLDVTTADSSISASHYIAVYQYLEAQDVRNSGWNYTSSSSYMTLSFWVRSSKAGTYCCHFRQEDVSDRYYVFEYTLAADTWTKVTHSLPGDSSAVFNNDSGAGLRIGWMLQAGSSRDNATANQWATSSGNAATSNQVNFFDSTDNDFYLTGVQFEVGERATPFEHRSYGDELAKCERYFEVIGGRSESFMGYAYASASAAVAIRYRTVKRAIPGTITLAPAGQSTGQITFLTAGGSYPSSTGNNTVEVITAQGFRVTGSSYSGLNANSPSNFYVTGSAGQTTTIAEVDAEL